MTSDFAPVTPCTGKCSHEQTMRNACTRPAADEQVHLPPQGERTRRVNYKGKNI